MVLRRIPESTPGSDVMFYLHREISHSIIAAAIEVHRALGPGLLESAYSACLCHELVLRELNFRTEVQVPVGYKGVHLDCGYRMDLVVED